MLNNTYRESMRSHPYGYALYEPESSAILRPGVLGYLTKYSTWVPLIGDDGTLIDFAQPASLLNNGLTALENFSKAPLDERSWGPKTSIGVNGVKVDLKANASLIPAGIPANVGALYTFQSSKDFGAILMTKDPVVRNFMYGDRSFREWGKQNSPRIFSRWPDVKNYGLIIVTSTHTTTQADINAWEDKQKSVSIGFKTGVVEVMEVAPSSNWYTASSDNGWITTKSSKPEDLKVVFFGGLYFKYHRLLPEQYRLQESSLDKLKAADSKAEEFEILYEKNKYNVVCEEIGHGEVSEDPSQAGVGDEEIEF